MQKDPIVEEVRRIRHEIECEHQKDPVKLFEFFQASQEDLRDRLVCREPKLLELLTQKERAA